MDDVDFLVIGAGIAGASVGYWLAPHGRTALLEREAHPGYHSTGRSAALFSETYGPPSVRALSRASRPFLEQPPAGFAEHPLLQPRGALMIGDPVDASAVQREFDAMRAATPGVRLLTAAQAVAMVPVLRPERTGPSLFEPDARDIDVHALHQGFLRGVRHAGGSIVCDAEVAAIERGPHGWIVHDAGGRQWRAARLIDAAGAWADRIAALAGVTPLGLMPRRRSAFTFAPPAGVDVQAWPLVIALDETWYFKPEAGLLLGSPANADPVEPHDVQAEELDVATAIFRIEQATTLMIRRPQRVWAGLRSFVADGSLVGGPDPEVPEFCWVAAQGGYGIQTAAAMGEACAALARGVALPAWLQDCGIDAALLSATRLRAPGAQVAARPLPIDPGEKGCPNA